MSFLWQKCVARPRLDHNVVGIRFLRACKTLSAKIGWASSVPTTLRSIMNFCRLLSAVSIVSLVIGEPALVAAQRSLKPEDFSQLRDVDEPNISPDGSLIVYVVKTADMEKDKLPGICGLRDGTARRIARLLLEIKARRIRAGARTENGSRFSRAARTRTRSTSFGFCRSAAVKQKN